MSKKDTLFKRIDAFLAEKKKSNGGYAPVTDQEMQQLRDIFDRLVALKYEQDPDGDLPVDAILVDRTRFEKPLYLPIRHTHKAVDGMSELELHQEAADRYSSIAQWATSRVQQSLKAVSYLLGQATKGQLPLTLGGNRYVVKPPAGLRVEDAKLALQGIAMKAYLKEPCPVDFDKRNKWAQEIAEAATKKLGCVVTARSCMHVSDGARMFFDVPALDASIRIITGSKNPENAEVQPVAAMENGPTEAPPNQKNRG
jgi:hypothetical protein